MAEPVDYYKKEEKEETIRGFRGRMVPAIHSRLSTPERDLIHFLFFCMLRNIDFIEVERRRIVSTFHNRTLNLFFDNVVDLLIEIDTTGGYKDFIRNGMIEAKGKLFERPESILPFLEGVPVTAKDVHIRIDNHDRKIIENFLSCFEKYFGPSSEIGFSTSILKITNYTLSRFLMKLWKMMLRTYSKRHFRDSIDKRTVELIIFEDFL